MPSERSDELLDLGMLELSLAERSTGGVESSPVAATPKESGTLVGKPLPTLEAFNLNLKDVSQATMSRRIIVCFWEMNQRPSRHCIRTLGKMTDQLAKKGVVAVSVHTAKIGTGHL